MDQRKILLQFVALNAAELRAKALCDVACGGLEIRRAHVIRRRVDEIAGEERSFRHPRQFRSVHAIRRHQPHLGAVHLAVTAEAVTAERKGKRGKPCIMRRVGEAVSAGRQ